MQTRRASRTESDRAKQRSGVVLWRPDIVLASGSVLTSLAHAREVRSVRTAEVRAPETRANYDAPPLFDGSTDLALELALSRPSIQISLSSNDRGWK